MKPVPLLSMLLLALGSAGSSAGESATRRGAELFSGAAALQGTIVGHSSALPPAAARCINCHAIGTAAPASAASAASFGPLLTRHGLTAAVARRGGPPSRYDAPAFCRLLRQGFQSLVILDASAGLLPGKRMPQSCSDKKSQRMSKFVATFRVQKWDMPSAGHNWSLDGAGEALPNGRSLAFHPS